MGTVCCWVLHQHLYLGTPKLIWYVASFPFLFHALILPGVFQAFYQQALPNTSASDISWIGTIQACFLLVGSVYSGPLYDLGYLRPLIAVGSFMVIFGMFMTSFCNHYWQLMLAQGIFVGMGLGCLYTPYSCVILSHFSKRRGLAFGIASTGSAIGAYPQASIMNKYKLLYRWCRVADCFLEAR